MLQSIKIFVENKIQAWRQEFFPAISRSWESPPYFQQDQILRFQSLQSGRPAPTSPSAGLWTAPANLKGANPTSLVNQVIDWAEEIQREQVETLNRDSARKTKEQTLSTNAEIKRLTHLLLLALRSGNINMAMMIFSHLEARSANEVTRCLMEKTQTLQEHKRELSLQIQQQGTDVESGKNIQKIKTDMDQANDDISVLQTFIKDVAQNKQESIELANAFITREHETAMSILQSWGR